MRIGHTRLLTWVQSFSFLQKWTRPILFTECYYNFNYKDHWDPGLFTCYTLLYNIIKWCCISWSAIRCSVLYISTSYRVLVMHTYLITILRRFYIVFMWYQIWWSRIKNDLTWLFEKLLKHFGCGRIIGSVAKELSLCWLLPML